MNAALREALTGVHLSWDGETFRADIRLRVGDGITLMDPNPGFPGYQPADALEFETMVARRFGLCSEPDHFTFVYVQPKRRPISW